MTAKTHKSLQDLRTLSGQITEAEEPQRRHARLAILELEKVRRNKELDRAMRQVQHLDRRLNEIMREQEQLLAETPPTIAPARSAGDLTITVADIEMIYLRLQLTLCAIDTGAKRTD